MLLGYLAGLGTDKPTAEELDDVKRFCQWVALMQLQLKSRKPLTSQLNGSLLVQHLMEVGDEEAVLAVLDMEEFLAARPWSLRNQMGHTILDSALALGRRTEALCMIEKVDPSVLLEPGLEVDCVVARSAFEGDEELLAAALARLLQGEHRSTALQLALGEATRGGWPHIVDKLISMLRPGETPAAVLGAVRAAARGELQTAEALPILLPMVHSDQLLVRPAGFAQSILEVAARQACPEVLELMVDKLVDEQEQVGPEGETTLGLLLAIEWPIEDVEAVVVPILDRMRPEALALPQGSSQETALIQLVKARKYKLAQAVALRMEPDHLAIQDREGRTALIYAVIANDVPMATILTSLMSVGKAVRDKTEKNAQDYCTSPEMSKLPLGPAVKGAGM